MVKVYELDAVGAYEGVFDAVGGRGSAVTSLGWVGGLILIILGYEKWLALERSSGIS